MYRLLAFVFLAVPGSVSAFAQQSSSDAPVAIIPAAAIEPSPEAIQPKEDHRILGVLPNYRTADGTRPFVPLTTHQKFYIAMKDTFDWPEYFIAGAISGLYQAENQNPSFGQGAKGYARRYVTSYGDQAIGNLMTEAVMPSLLKEDPRYFRKVHGSFGSRVGYALTRILVAKTDRGKTTFNFSEVVGNGITATIANAYYPGDRTAMDTMQRWGNQLSTDAISNVLKEFWPDIKRKFFRRRVEQDPSN